MYSDEIKNYIETDWKYRYKPKDMGVEDYSLQRALNEIYRRLEIQGEINMDEFMSIINFFDLARFAALDKNKKEIHFIKWTIGYNPFTRELDRADNRFYALVNPLSDKEMDCYSNIDNLESPGSA